MGDAHLAATREATTPAREEKTFTVSDVKMRQDDPPGTFEAVVSVFGNIDRGGDVVLPGAFANTLKERGLPPILWMHNHDLGPIGVASVAKETSEGLFIKGRLFIDGDVTDPFIHRVWIGLKEDAIREFSFGYAVRESAWEDRDGQEVRLLKDLELFEVSPVVAGMNPATRLVGVKDLDIAVHLDGKKIAEAVASTRTDRDPADGGTDDQPLALVPTDGWTRLMLATQLDH